MHQQIKHSGEARIVTAPVSSSEVKGNTGSLWVLMASPGTARVSTSAPHFAAVDWSQMNKRPEPQSHDMLSFLLTA